MKKLNIQRDLDSRAQISRAIPAANRHIKKTTPTTVVISNDAKSQTVPGSPTDTAPSDTDKPKKGERPPKKDV